MSYPNSGESQSGDQASDQWGQAGQWGSPPQHWGQQDPGGQPHGQPSGASAGWQHQAGWQQQWQQPSPGQSPSASFGQTSGGHQPPPRDRQTADANPFRAAFDFGFNHYVTPGLVKIIYVLAVILAVIWWIGGAIMTFVMGGAVNSASSEIYGNSGGSGGTGFIVLGVLDLLLGWIPALLWLLFIRIILEASMALVRLATDMRSLRHNAGA